MTTKETVTQVINVGLFTTEPEPHFSHRGCEVCCPGQGATVYSGQGYLSLAAAHTDKEDFYEFQICGECLNSLYYGENL